MILAISCEQFHAILPASAPVAKVSYGGDEFAKLLKRKTMEDRLSSVSSDASKRPRSTELKHRRLSISKLFGAFASTPHHRIDTTNSIEITIGSSIENRIFLRRCRKQHRKWCLPANCQEARTPKGRTVPPIFAASVEKEPIVDSSSVAASEEQ